MNMKWMIAVAILVAPFGAASQGVQVRDATGALVGLYVGGAGPDQEQGPPGSIGPAFRIVSAQGFVAVYGVSSGRITVGTYAYSGFYVEAARVNQGLYFETSDCSGASWLSVDTPGGPMNGGFVVATALATYQVHYVPKTAVAQTIVARSLLNQGGCSAMGSTTTQALPALPNDPAVTGVPNQPFQPPLTLGVADSAWLMFRDGFESAVVPSLSDGVDRVG